MSCKVMRHLVVVGALLLIVRPVAAHAQQQATLIGTVTDSTGAVLPGVTVTAVHEASGNTFVAVTDERGGYRLPVRTGGYRMTAELSGFTIVARTGLELLLSQEAVIDFQLRVSTVQETVTVTGIAPLVDVTRSRASGNIDTRQMQELPINGRNYLDLTLLAPGSRTNAAGDAPTPNAARGAAGRTNNFQIHLDGQQVTDTRTGAGGDVQPKFSRDAIAEFEFITNRFDATQGRSAGTQINVITKSGTNTASGTFAGYFRDDRFNAADFVARRVLPYSNQQVGGTFGGPIRKDRVHFFASYEYEREPQTAVFNTPYPRFNTSIETTLRQNKALGRVDMQVSPQTRLAVRASYWDAVSPWAVGGVAGQAVSTSIPNATNATNRHVQVSPIFTQVLSSRAVNEVKGGYVRGLTARQPRLTNPNSPLKDIGITNIAPGIRFRGFSVEPLNTPLRILHQIGSIRDDFSISFNRGGRHDVKTGGEYYYRRYDYGAYGTVQAGGLIDATGGPVPANIEDLFPDWQDVSTWNLAALAPITRLYGRGIAKDNKYDISRPRGTYAAWFQDDWKVTPRLTLNLGVRYDLERGARAEDIVFEPFLPPGRGADTNNIAPRLGAAFSLNDRTVLRGGWGKFFAEIADFQIYLTEGWSEVIIPQVLNDGRRDFVVNPFNGPEPTFEQLQQRLCHVVNRPGCVRQDIPNSFASKDLQYPFGYQASAGVQRQLGETMAVEADYVYTAGRQEVFQRNVNLSYNPATGANYPFTDISRRPYPEWGSVVQAINGGWSNYHGLQTAFTKRFSHGWQASGTYLLSGTWSAVPAPDVGFPLGPDMGGEYTLAPSDQRHRATFNGVWEMPYGFQLSGLYFFGSGVRYVTTYGGDLRFMGTANFEEVGRLRPNGTIVPRNNFVGDPIHRVDVRVQRRFRLGGRASIDGIAEVFNLFNHANYGAYTTVESSPSYGRPSQNLNVAYAPRTLQLGFRLAF